MFTGKTPDITPAQQLALAVFIVGQLVAFGLIDAQSKQLAISITSTVIAVVLKLADAYLRGKRAQALAPSQQPIPPAAG